MRAQIVFFGVADPLLTGHQPPFRRLAYICSKAAASPFPQASLQAVPADVDVQIAVARVAEAGNTQMELLGEEHG